MERALSGYTYLRKWGNSTVIIVSKEAELLQLQEGDLVKFRITRADPNIEEEKPKKKKKEAPEVPTEEDNKIVAEAVAEGLSDSE